MEGNRKRRGTGRQEEGGPEEERGPEEEGAPEESTEAQASEATPQDETPAEPPRGRRRYLLTAGIAAGVVALGAALFVAGFWTHSLLDDDVDLRPIEDKLVALDERTTQIQEALRSAGGNGDGGGTSPSAATSSAADDDPAWGPEDAPIVMVEFSDFQCPFCRRFASETLPSIREAYGDKVRFIYRDFPISSIHQFAQKAAEAGQCAQEQGLFWEYHDVLFENQDALDVPDLKGYAEEVGLDTGQFNDCLDSGKYQQEVLRDLQDGRAAGVTGTPGFLIKTGDDQYVPVSGARPFEQFQQVLDQLLAGEG